MKSLLLYLELLAEQITNARIAGGMCVMETNTAGGVVGNWIGAMKNEYGSPPFP